jgi:MYXO-CTERM domain-containing protein
MRTQALAIALVLGGFGFVEVRDASACGCFTPPDPSVPIVQAGEKILFAIADGQVTAHIQIQYQGSASDFGWILPLPSIPKLELGTDELFTALYGQTQPKYELKRVYDGFCSFDPSRNTFPSVPMAGGGVSGGSEGDQSGHGPLVFQDSIGPYDYAVLKADSKDEMLKWLSDNRYFVPAGTDGAVGPYIHTGAYFLALKLHKGADVGDLQPVVVRYASDLAMIPIVLTSVAAKPDMGIQVWMLGDGRAIPRNYYHTVVNDAKLDWLRAGANYNDVIIAATHEAPKRHTFVTEFAGSAERMRGQLDPPGRFAAQSQLALAGSDVDFVTTMLQSSYPLTAQTVAVLQRYIPAPPKLLARYGISAAQFYRNIQYYLGSYRQQYPDDFVGWTENFQPAEMAAELQTKVVEPTQAAAALFQQFPYLTRLYTTLSPEDMSEDPVFSYNRELKDVSNQHTGTLTYHCGLYNNQSAAATPATLRTADGWVVEYPKGTGVSNFGGGQPTDPFVSPAGPSSQRIEILRDQGQPDVITDNAARISSALGDGGCGVGFGGRASRNMLGAFGMVAVAALLLLRRRRSSGAADSLDR